MTQAPYASIGNVFPVKPEPSDLRRQYEHLRKAAITVNRSRGQYIRQVKKRDVLIDQLQEEISSYANDARLDYQERAQLLGILTKYRDVFSSLEKAGDEMVEGIEEYELSNGLKVLLYPDQAQSKVIVNITYRVGSVHENYGETGMAHLLEHMLFKGSTNFTEIDKEFNKRGGRGRRVTEGRVSQGPRRHGRLG